MAYTKLELIEMIAETEQKLGKKPLLKDIKENSGASKQTFIRAFGSYRNAYQVYQDMMIKRVPEYALDHLKKIAEEYTSLMQCEESGVFDGFTSLSALIVTDVLDIDSTDIYPSHYCYDFYDEEFGNVNVLEAAADNTGDWIFDLSGDFEPDFRILVLWDADYSFIESVYLIHYTKTNRKSYIRFRDLEAWTSCELPVQFFNRALRRLNDNSR
jgi:hypothetical protein